MNRVSVSILKRKLKAGLYLVVLDIKSIFKALHLPFVRVGRIGERKKIKRHRVIKERHNNKKMPGKKALKILLLFFVLLLFLLVFISFVFLRQRQLCRYNQQVTSGELILEDGAKNLCPNFLSANNIPKLIINAFDYRLPGKINLNQNYSIDILENREESCVDDSDPVCWLKQTNATLKQTDGFTNLLMVGSDTRRVNGDLTGNTDSIMLVSYNHTSGKVMLTSFTRDLYVKVNTPMGWRSELKINALYSNYGQEGLIMAVEEITGKPIHYYALFSFQTFINLIDQLGGVDVYLDKPFHDLFPCNELPQSKGCFTYGHDWFDFPQGWNHFDSYDALIYARARYNSSDYDRAKRQQDIVNAIMDSAIEKDLGLAARFNLYKGLYETLKSEVDTNVGLQDISAVMKLFDRLSADPARVVVDPFLGGDSEIVYIYGIHPDVGWTTMFRDYTYNQFQEYINNIWVYLPYYIERPKILVVSSEDSNPLFVESVDAFINTPNPYWEVKREKKELNYSGIRIYDMSKGLKVGSLRDLQSKLKGALVFNPEIDGVTSSGWGEDILVIIGK